MIYTVRHFMYQIYPFISHIGFTSAVPPYVFMASLNHAINFVFAYGGYRWSRQHWKDTYTQICGDRVRLRTTRPIHKVDGFYCGPIQPINCDECGSASDLTNCLQPLAQDSCCSGKGTYLDMSMIAPHAQLLPGQYQIQNDISYYNPDGPGCRYGNQQCPKNGTELVDHTCDDCSIQQPLVCGMGGIGGNRIELMLPCNCNCACDSKTSGMWVTYYRGPQHLTSMKDYVYIPQGFTTVLAYMTAHYLLPAHGIARQYDDVNYYNRAIAMLQELKKHDTDFANSIVSDA